MDKKDMRVYPSTQEEHVRRLMNLFENGFRNGFKQIIWYFAHPSQFYDDMRYRKYCNIFESNENPGETIRHPGDNLLKRLFRY